MKIAVFSTKSYDKIYLEKHKANSKHTFTYFETTLNDETTNLSMGFEGICVFVNDKIDKKTIENLSKNGIKLIALRCAGFNNVDLKAAQKENIKVVRVPAYSPQAVAEHAVAMILTLNRKTHKVYNRVRESNFSLENLTGFNLFGKTIGVIGTGQIGIAFCKIMIGFGCKIIAYDLKESAELISQGVDYQSIDKVLSNSHIISLHCPLTEKTHHLFDKSAFSKMKNGAMLINTSRGALIKTEDVIEALKKGEIGYLGIDVYEQEENLFFKDLSESIIQDDLIQRLISFPNVLITPHQGFFTEEALTQIAITTIKNISDFEKVLNLENEVKI
jgi:D-lactate dehydrogenase